MRRMNIGDTVVDVEVTFKAVKNVNLRVHRDGTVHVSAPKGTAVDLVEFFVCKNKDFIVKTLQKFAAQPKPQENTACLLGTRFPLAVRTGSIEKTYMEEDTLVIETPNPDRAQMILEAREQSIAEHLFPEIVARVLPLMQPYGVTMPRITVRRMKTRWGSCTMSKGSIRLNTRLVRYPMACIEQVALHELCHFVHPDHSGAFYDLMTRLLPDWRTYRDMLNRGEYE